MSAGFFAYLLLLLLLRAVFYYAPIRRSLPAYGVRVLIETLFLFLFFRTNVIPALAIPGVLLLIAMLSWALESRVLRPTSVEGDRRALLSPVVLIGLFVTVTALGVIFASGHAPTLKEWTGGAGTAATRGLFAACAGVIVFFEIGHLIPGVSVASGRLIAFGLWVGGSLLGAAVIVSGSIALEVLIADPAVRRREAMRGSTSVVLAVVAAVGARWTIGTVL